MLHRGLQRSNLTVEEFLGLEFAVNKVELVDGQVYELADSSVKHNRVVTNSIAVLLPITRELGFDFFVLSVALKVGPTTAYFPDAFVNLEGDNESELFCTKPCLIVEVLSPETAATDHREKRIAYQRIATMRDYLIVDSEAQTVDHFHRRPGEAWSRAVLTSGDSCQTVSIGPLAIDALFVGS